MLMRTSRRYLQTVRPSPTTTLTPLYGSLPSSTTATSSEKSWAKHSLPTFTEETGTQKSTKSNEHHNTKSESARPRARPFMVSQSIGKSMKNPAPQPQQHNNNNNVNKSTATTNTNIASKTSVEQEQNKAATAAAKPTERKRKLKPRKAAITLTPTAVEHLKNLLNSPDPKMIRVGVKNKGCSGLTYHLEYVDKAGKFDEEISQDGVKVLIDSKALFSIIGSEMDWIDDKLSSRFIFNNPNSKGQCGCGESFMV